jgi:two-component system response regulator YesN
MLKVMIVDDEPLILSGLRHFVDWERLGFNIVCEAPHGAAALERLRTTPCDVLITDIRMPELNGLELIQEANAILPHLRCIILSGYDDFNYVKEAMKLGIENYLLKPVSDTELASTLSSIRDKMLFERQSRNEQGSSIIRNNIVYRWMTGDIEEEELLSRSELLGLPVHQPGYRVTLIRSMSREGASILLSEGLRLCERWLQPLSALMTFNLQDDVAILLPIVNAEHGVQSSEGLLRSCLERMREELGLCCLAAVGERVSDRSMLHISYYQAFSLLPVMALEHGDNLRLFDAYGEQQSNLLADFRADFDALRLVLEAKDTEAASGLIDTAIARIRERYAGQNTVYVRSFLLELLVEISIIRNGKIHSIDSESGSQLLRNAFFSPEAGIDDQKQAVKLYMQNCLTQLENDSSRLSPVVAHTLHYLQQHYAEDINLQSVSRDMRANAAYFGQLFRRETGESFNACLNRIRVEKAKDLLLNTYLKANEVAQEVGYASPNYFHTVFKRLTGVSPHEYKASRSHHT